jgi:hypothetical protein
VYRAASRRAGVDVLASVRGEMRELRAGDAGWLSPLRELWGSARRADSVA